jgi:diaminopimelate epimerase
MFLEFFKYQATGNDFIIIDNREMLFDKADSALITSLCERKYGVGADGLILLENDKHSDFKMIYFNKDGCESTMCGNGGRCIMHFANLLEIFENDCNFNAIDGLHKGRIIEDVYSLKMQDVIEINKFNDYLTLDTGSPHCVNFCENLNDLDVNIEGEKIRNNKFFKNEGINVNFVDPNKFSVRTFERGVEEETFSCGTGTVASALSLHFANYLEEDNIDILTKGGLLSVSFQEFNGTYKNIWLTGPASLVYVGEFEC